jgi:hypothetical protein
MICDFECDWWVCHGVLHWRGWQYHQIWCFKCLPDPIRLAHHQITVRRLRFLFLISRRFLPVRRVFLQWTDFSANCQVLLHEWQVIHSRTSSSILPNVHSFTHASLSTQTLYSFWNALLLTHRRLTPHVHSFTHTRTNCTPQSSQNAHPFAHTRRTLCRQTS